MFTDTVCSDAHVYGAFSIAYGVGAACELLLFGATCSAVITVTQWGQLLVVK